MRTEGMTPGGTTDRGRRRTAAVLITAAACTATAGVVAAPAAAAACSDVEIVFARGSGEAPGLGILGRPLVTGLTSALADRSVSSYAVDYAAAANQSSAGPGATDLSQHVIATAASCPGTRFVLGGYSQGASVVSIAIGLRTSLGSGTTIPAALAGRVDAIVVFGNPLGISRQTIEQSSATYGSKAKSFCATGDPVCGGGGNFAAHLAYSRDGSIPSAVTFAAGRVQAGGGSTGGGGTDGGGTDGGGTGGGTDGGTGGGVTVPDPSTRWSAWFSRWSELRNRWRTGS